MTAKQIAVKRYVVMLSDDEREQLDGLIHAGKYSARLLTKARILLKADASEAGRRMERQPDCGGPGYPLHRHGGTDPSATGGKRRARGRAGPQAFAGLGQATHL